MRETIVGLDGDRRPLLERLTEYERQMISHGFRAARISLADMERSHTENPISRTSAKTFMRTADRLPTL